MEIVGLGSSSMVDSVTVHCASGHIDRLTNLVPNQTIDLIEGSTTSGLIHSSVEAPDCRYLLDPELPEEPDEIESISSNFQPLGLPRSSFKAFPNPATDQICFPTPIAGTVRIHTLSGKTVRTIDLNSDCLKIAELPSQLYLLEVTIENKTYQTRFLKR